MSEMGGGGNMWHSYEWDVSMDKAGMPEWVMRYGSNGGGGGNGGMMVVDGMGQMEEEEEI